MPYRGQTDSLEPLVRDFLRASKLKRRRRIITQLIVLMLAIFVSLGLLFRAWWNEWYEFTPGVVFTPDKQYLVVTSDDEDNPVYLWNMANLSDDPSQLIGHFEPAVTAAVSPMGKWLATGDNDNFIHLWDLTNLAMEPKLLEGHGDSVRSLAFSPDGQILASGSLDDTIRLWYPNEPGVPAEDLFTEYLVDVVQLSFSEDGRYLVAVDKDDSVFLWELADLAAGPYILIYEGKKDD